MKREQLQEQPAAGWFALVVRPRHEKSATFLLREKGFDVVAPTQRVRRRWSDRFKEVEEPLFPGYVFCLFNRNRRRRALETPGVMRLVEFGGEPCEIPAIEIENLRRLARSGVAAAPRPYLAVGERVCIIHGPLAGVSGVLEYSQEDRLVLSVALLQRSVAVEIDRAWVRRSERPRRAAGASP